MTASNRIEVDYSRKYGKWTPIREERVLYPSGSSRAILCRCECGSERCIRLSALLALRYHACSKCRFRVHIDYDRQYGSWTPLHEVMHKGKRHVLCRCKCGVERKISVSKLVNPDFINQCNTCAVKERSTSHGMTSTPEYTAWINIKHRCYNPKNKCYHNYGGRGIKVCDRWLESFENFLADIGPKPGPKHSIERIDNDGNYEPGNCKWATRAEQSRNRRNIRMVTYQGKTQCLKDWALEVGINRNTIAQRLQKGWSVEQALTLTPKPAKRSRLQSPSF